ncbi:MAG: potassium channel family protein [Pirellulales bacterium]
MKAIRNSTILYLELITGLALIALVLSDVFQSVVLPRRTNSIFRLAPHLLLLLWPIWRKLGLRLHPAWRREDFLGTFAPLAILLLLAVWFVTLLCGFGFILEALADQVRPPVDGFSTAFYVAGTSLLTIGYGDYVPTALPARLVVLLAGSSGLTILALVISLAFNLYSSFGRREVLVLLLDARAGVPPSGVMLLETYGRLGIVPRLAETFDRYELWTAEMLDSHLAYPLLPFFRSSHDGQSWVSALGAVLDAATLLTTTVPQDTCKRDESLCIARASAEMMYSIGCHALVDLTQLPVARLRISFDDTNPGIERAEFETACRQLAEAGYPTEASDATWQAFSERRAVYATRLNLLARFFASPPTQWIGDRTLLVQRHWPHFQH